MSDRNVLRYDIMQGLHTLSGYFDIRTRTLTPWNIQIDRVIHSTGVWSVIKNDNMTILFHDMS